MKSIVEGSANSDEKEHISQIMNGELRAVSGQRKKVFA
jgi:hypothetical protein